MDPSRLMTQEATITNVSQSAAKDEYGDPTATTVTATKVDCWLHQVARTEHGDNNNVQDQRWALYVPPGTILNGSDRVTVEGVTYEVEGPPWPAHNPRLRRVTHIEATLRRVT